MAVDNMIIFDSLSIPSMNNLYDISKSTGLSRTLLYCLSMKTSQYYKRYFIPKKDGTMREICAPSFTMRVVQKWILRNILDKAFASPRAMAFRRGNKYGIKRNALYHQNALYGLHLDLKDFFPSIGAEKVYTIFGGLGYNSEVSTILTHLCTLDGYLPQGGVCSPALSNLVCRGLDKRFNGLCEKRGIRYTRYADDMLFSCDNKDLLHKIFPVIEKIIDDEGFAINERKTHYYTPSNKKSITGITVIDSNIEKGDVLKANKCLKNEIRFSIFHMIATCDYTNKGRVLGLVSYVNYIESQETNTYLEKTRAYILKCIEKNKMFTEVISKYNQNKFYSDMENITPNVVMCETEEELEEIQYLIEQRKSYLMKYKVEDICMYKNFPFTVFENRNSCLEDSELPFC